MAAPLPNPLSPRENPDLNRTGFQLGEVGRPLPTYDHHFTGVYPHPSNLKPVELDTYDKVNYISLNCYCFMAFLIFRFSFISFPPVYPRSMVYGNVLLVTWMAPLTMVVIVYALMIAIWYVPFTMTMNPKNKLFLPTFGSSWVVWVRVCWPCLSD